VEQRKLGTQGPALSVVGVGTWAIGGDNWDYGWGPQDDADSLRAIQAAFDLGVNWVDTAPVYGFGHAEEVVAKALRGRRDEVVLASKFGLLWDAEGKTYRDGRPATVRKEIEDSLRRLQTDHLDIYHQHWPDWDFKTPVAETMEVLVGLQEAGKIRHIGVSNYDVTQLGEALGVHHVDSLQPPYNLVDRSAETELLPYCQAHGVGVVVYSPLMNGLLAGQMDEETKFSDTDWRGRDERFYGEGLRQNLAMARRVKTVAEGLGCSQAQLAVAWTLANPAVTAAIVGFRNGEEPADLLEGLPGPLEPATMAALRAGQD